MPAGTKMAGNGAIPEVGCQLSEFWSVVLENQGKAYKRRLHDPDRIQDKILSFPEIQDPNREAVLREHRRDIPEAEITLFLEPNENCPGIFHDLLSD